MVNWDSTLINSNQSYDVYYYQDIIAYKLNYRFDSLVNGKSVLQENRSFLFIFHKDSLFGHSYYLNSNPLLPNERLNVDSVLTKNRFETTIWDTIFNMRPDSSYNDADGNLVKVYFNPVPPKQSHEKFDLYLYYSKKFNYVHETFSKKMDNVNRMKLYKVRVVASGGYYEEHKMTFPQREYLHEMKEVPAEDQEDIFAHFKKYKDSK